MEDKVKIMAKKRVFLVVGGVIILMVITALVIRGFNFKKKELPFTGTAWFSFSDGNALKDWEEKIFKEKVLYSLKKERGNGYLNAYSKDAASAMMRWLKFDPTQKPMVSWKWKVTKFPEKNLAVPNDSSWIEKEDYAARFYVIFPRFPFFRLQALEYVWSKDLAAGTVLTNPNFQNLKIIVVESGEQNLGKWVYVERNVCEDFKKFFDANPGQAGAIAVMTDSENTASTAEAQYDEIKVGYDGK